ALLSQACTLERRSPDGGRRDAADRRARSDDGFEMTRCISLGPAELKRHPLPPVEEADKDARGRLLLIAGSRDLPGAAQLAAIAALRAGAGKLQVATTESAAAQL